MNIRLLFYCLSRYLVTNKFSLYRCCLAALANDTVLERQNVNFDFAYLSEPEVGSFY